MRSEEFIKSFVRIKPLSHEQYSVLSCNRREVIFNRTKQPYSYHQVFNETANNDYIYEKTILPIMPDLFRGYNACILAYGQTSSGKTYTMKGVNQSLGLIPQSIKHIFKQIKQEKLIAKVSISYFQIYNENVIDLLSQQEPPKYLQLREDGKKNLIITDLIQEVVEDQYKSLSFYQKGELKRKFASNNINFNSSRSHTIFKIKLEVVTDENQIAESSISMVDLAGSQSASKTNASGSLKKEGENINKSLLALSTVIRSISEKQTQFTFRNSKLTRILQPCLSGNSKTIVICTIKQTQQCTNETINTLKFGQSANSIKVTIRQNITNPFENAVEDRYKQLTQILTTQRQTIKKLEYELGSKNQELLRKQDQINYINQEFEELKKKLFALQNENRHNNGLINFFKQKQDSQVENKNAFYQKTKADLQFYQVENKSLKLSFSNANQNLEKKNKKITILQKNERVLLDKIEKYERQLNSLQTFIKQKEKNISQPQEKPKRVNYNQGSAQIPNIKRRQISFHQIAHPPLPKSGLLTSPFTIGTVINLSTQILAMKIDMNHYLNTITQLQNEVQSLQVSIQSAKGSFYEERQVNKSRSSGRMGQSNVTKSKQEEKKTRILQNKYQVLKKQNENLRKKNNKFMKYIKQCANNNIEAIVGFNDYIDKHFKYDQKALFEQLMQDSPEDYEPFLSIEIKDKQNRQKI